MGTSGVLASARSWTRQEVFGLVLQQRGAPRVGGGSSPESGLSSGSSARKARSFLLQGLTMTCMEQVWLVLCEAIAGHLLCGKAFNVPGFGRFGLNRLRDDEPSLVLADAFTRAHGVSVMPSPIVLAGILDNVNVTGLSLEAKLSKDHVRAVVTDVFSCIGTCIAANARPVLIEFPGVGTLRAEARRVFFDFLEVGSEAGSGNCGLSARRSARRRFRGDDGETGTVASIPSARSSTVSLGLLGQVPRLKLGRTGAGRGCEHSVGSSASTLTYLSAASSGLGSIAESRYRADESSRSPVREAEPSSRSSRNIRSSRSQRNQRSQRSSRGEIANRPNPFYFRDRHSKLLREEDRLEWRLEQLDANLDTEFARIRADIDAQVDSLRDQDVDIARRNQMSEMAYKAKLLQMKKDQLKLNAFLIEQAQERRELEAKERAAFRGIGDESHLPEGRPYPLEEDPDMVKVARVKRNLDEALKDQIAHKTRLEHKARVEKVAEERFLGDCNTAVLRKDRELRHRKKREENAMLQAQWGRQVDLAAKQRLLIEARNGKILTLSTSLSQTALSL